MEATETLQPEMSGSAPASDGMPDASAAAEAPPSFEARPDLEIADDGQTIDALIEQARQAVETEAAASAEAPPAEPTTEPTAPPPPPPPPLDPLTDIRAAIPNYDQVLADLQARGFEVKEPPAPPDPYRELEAQLEPLVGTREEYGAARAQAMAPLPPLPADTDPDWQAKFDAHAHAVAIRDAAVTRVNELDAGRRVATVSRDWARQRALGELGGALEAVPQTYGLSPEQAKRVTQPETMTDAIAAVVEARDAYWQAQLAERERHWSGEQARTRVDQTAARMQRMGEAPAPGSVPGGRPGNSVLAAIFDGTAGPEQLSEDLIDRARRGALGGISLDG